MDSKNTQPSILVMLGQQSFALAKEIREEFVYITEKLTNKAASEIFIRTSTSSEEDANDLSDVLEINKINKIKWSDLKNETVCFIDGGVGQTTIYSKTPLILRSGIFKVITGEQDIDKREKFEVYPIIVGDIESGRKNRGDYTSVLRILIELIAAYKVAQTKEYSDTNILMLHGPISYRLSQYTDHYFSKKDMRYILGTNGLFITPKLKDENDEQNDFLDDFQSFCSECELNCEKGGFCDQRKSENVNFICMVWFLLYEIYQKVLTNESLELIGVVERSRATDYIRDHLFPKLLMKDINILTDFKLKASKDMKKNINNLIEKTMYHDVLLLSLILEEGEYTGPQVANRRFKDITREDFIGLSDLLLDTIPIKYIYLKVKHNTLPIRVEFPAEISIESIEKIVDRVYKYSRLLPTYAFPVGLDIVDKYAKVPNWLMDAFRKLILLKLGNEAVNVESLEEIRKLVSNVLIFQQRDGLYRPKA